MPKVEVEERDIKRGRAILTADQVRELVRQTKVAMRQSEKPKPEEPGLTEEARKFVIRY